VEERFARGRREERTPATSSAIAARREDPEANVPLHLRPPREGIDDDDDMPVLSPEVSADRNMELERDAADMKDDRSDYAPIEPAERDTKNEDAEMGIVAGILELETPVTRLFKICEEEYEDAVEAKSKRKSIEEAVTSMTKDKRLCGIIQQLPDTAVEVLIQQMSGVFEEAEPLGVIAERHSEAIVNEINAVVSEIYSPPRVTKTARILSRRGILPGFALDLTTHDDEGNPWDFDVESQESKAVKLLYDTEPDLLVGSPMCKDFSPWQRLNKARSPNPEKYVSAKRSSLNHLEFVCHTYEIQYSGGRLLLHEHPQQASSWDEECIVRIMKLPGVDYIDMDQCQLGQKDSEGNPIKKPTRWLSNSRCILEALSKRCGGRRGWCDSGDGLSKHAPCYGKVAANAAIYPFKFCRAILRVCIEEMKQRDRWDAMANLVMPPTHNYRDFGFMEAGCNPEKNFEDIMCVLIMFIGKYKGAQFTDDLTGQPLDPRLVKIARSLEMEYFRGKDVYTKRPRAEAIKRTGRPPIGVRWVDVNKGDDEDPNYRSRLVAKQFKRKGDDNIFAPTPPLEALRAIWMLAATPSIWAPTWAMSATDENRLRISFVDISMFTCMAPVPRRMGGIQSILELWKNMVSRLVCLRHASFIIQRDICCARFTGTTSQPSARSPLWTSSLSF